MARKPNPMLRLIVPVIGVAVAVGITIAAFNNSGKPRATPENSASAADAASQAPASAATTAGDAGPTSAESIAAQPVAPVAQGAPSAPTAAPATTATDAATTDPALDITTWIAQPTATAWSTGVDLPVSSSSATSGPSTLRAVIHPAGAGIARLELPGERAVLGKPEPVVLQSERIAGTDAVGNPVAAIPFALLDVEIRVPGRTGSRVVPLTGAGGATPVWTLTPDASSGTLTAVATIGPAGGQPALRLTRVFRYDAQAPNELVIEQFAENLTAMAVDMTWNQAGQVTFAKPENAYVDKRRFRYAYLLPTQVGPEAPQAGSAFVTPDTSLDGHATLVGGKVTLPNGSKGFAGRVAIWPDKHGGKPDARRHLVWHAVTDRYFAVAVHQRLTTAPTRNEDRVLWQAATLSRIVLNPYAARAEDAEALMTMISAPRPLPAATASGPGRLDASLAVYAGPLSHEFVDGQAASDWINLRGLVAFNLGGPCGPCTFGWLTGPIFWILKTLHAVSSDWSIAIMLLVLVVRGVLHPVTRWSQIKVSTFGVQMAAMAPKMKQVQEKYADDKARQQQEMAKLWKEEGVSPLNAVGCLPMLLQTPVWMALYAVLFFAFDLRHQGAFYGLFQMFGGWGFIADLAEPDRAIPLPFKLNLGILVLDAVNVLPLLLAVVYYIHQKFMQPPTTATMSDEQKQQQAIMKWMTVIMFPLIMYQAPSGLSLYFITNSVLGIVESKWIRAHMKQNNLLDAEHLKKQVHARREARSSRGPGFLEKLQTMAAEQQKLREQRGPGKAVRKIVENQAKNARPAAAPPSADRFKKRK